MTLREKQSLFVRLIGKLIAWADENGYELTWGEAKRSDEQAEINALGQIRRTELADLVRAQFPTLASKIVNNGAANGIRGSLHEVGLAVDLNLFRAGKFLSTSKDHEPLGLHWESLNPLCRWGGRFNDGNHYSLEHEGKK